MGQLFNCCTYTNDSPQTLNNDELGLLPERNSIQNAPLIQDSELYRYDIEKLKRKV